MDNTKAAVKEWIRVHDAKFFSIADGKDVEFGVFLKLYLASGCDYSRLNTTKMKAHQICEAGVEAGYLLARG